MKLALVMMVKNEEKRLRVSLDSVRDYVDMLIIYDTGSTDKTMDILRDFSEETKLPLHLKQGEFVDFSVSRNVLLDYAAETDADYLILFDCNDELQGGQYIKGELAKYPEKEAFLVYQEWLAGVKKTKYRNTRIVKNKVPWRYKKKVHEYISRIEEGGDPKQATLDGRIVIFQNRNEDDDKTSKRFIRDKVLLLEAVSVENPDARDVFYLAQTCACLHEYEEAVSWYTKRAGMEGFWEEKFQANLRAGEILLDHLKEGEKALSYFLKAFEIDKRVEPLVRLGQYYRGRDQWMLAHLFLKLASELPYPEYATLFVDKMDYDYTRWFLLGIVSYYIRKDDDGIKACKMAIATGINTSQNEANLKFYMDRKENDMILAKAKELEEKKDERKGGDNSAVQEKETRANFTNRRTLELRSRFPKITPKDLQKRIDREWKSRKLKKDTSPASSVLRVTSDAYERIS